MNTKTLKTLEEQAELFYRYRELAPEEKEWLYPLLSRRVHSTLEIIDLISEGPLTYEEIADELDMNLSTVTQKINALVAGGYPIDLTERGAFAHTGRPRTLAKEADEKKAG